MRSPSDEPDPFFHGSLTDVAGVSVGHHQRTGRGWQTGTTAVIVPEGAVAAVDVRGGGPGTRETDALDPHNLVDRVHGVCLSGGSAFGLAAADGVMAHLEARGLGIAVGPGPNEVVPVVPAAVIFDLGRGGVYRNRPTPEFGRRAADRARPVNRRRGSIGAGSGARAGGLQGGVGQASILVDLDDVQVRVAALAVVNACGSVIDRSTGLPWVPVKGLRRPPAAERRAMVEAIDTLLAAPLNTTLGLIATDAVLDRPEVGRLAMSAHDGLARAVRPAHSLMDGDTIFGLAVPRLDLPKTLARFERTGASRAVLLNRLSAAAADVFATACIDAVLSATTIGGARAYRDLCPSALPNADCVRMD